jgi:hypothetical protein
MAATAMPALRRSLRVIIFIQGYTFLGEQVARSLSAPEQRRVKLL